MTRWGANASWSQSATGAAYNVFRLMGGTSHDVDDMVLSTVTVNFGIESPFTHQTVRVAVYAGGALDNPSGAALVEDVGAFTTDSTAQKNYVLTGAGTAAIPKNTPLWIAAKTDAGNSLYLGTRVDSTNAGDFQTARGRANSASPTGGTNPSVAFPATLDGTMSFSSFWYGWYLDYDIAPPPSGHLADFTAGGSPFTLNQSPSTGNLMVITDA